MTRHHSKVSTIFGSSKFLDLFVSEIKLILTMKSYFLYSRILLLIPIIFLACNKSDSNNLITPSFVWSIDGNSYTANVIEAHTNGTGGPRVIFGDIGTNSFTFERGVDLIITSFDIGSYQYQSPMTNLIRYKNDPNLIAGSINTTVNITDNSNNLLSGNFSGLVSNMPGVTRSISGSFKNIAILP